MQVVTRHSRSKHFTVPLDDLARADEYSLEQLLAKLLAADLPIWAGKMIRGFGKMPFI
jgi:hypothetical protein